MNPETSSSTTNSSAILPHCQQRTPSGRRCRMAVSDPDSGLCSKHAAEQKKLDSINLAATLIGDTGEFTSAVTINRSLGELYKLLARDEIAPRRAAVMAYTASLLLRTLPAIEHERTDNEGIEWDFSDWPDPTDGSGIKGPACFRRGLIAKRDQQKALPQSSGNSAPAEGQPI